MKNTYYTITYKDGVFSSIEITHKKPINTYNITEVIYKNLKAKYETLNTESIQTVREIPITLSA